MVFWNQHGNTFPKLPPTNSFCEFEFVKYINPNFVGYPVYFYEYEKMFELFELKNTKVFYEHCYL